MAVSEAQKRATAKYEAENYDKILVRFSKGTKDRIKNQSESVNAYIIQAVIERLEADEDERLQEPIQTAQKAEISHETETVRENTEEPPKSENKTNNKPKNAKTEAEQLAELQAMIESKRAKQKEQEEIVKQVQEQRAAEKKAEEQAEVNKILDRILSGSEPEEDAEKEALRQESIAKAKCPF